MIFLSLDLTTTPSFKIFNPENYILKPEILGPVPIVTPGRNILKPLAPEFPFKF